MSSNKFIRLLRRQQSSKNIVKLSECSYRLRQDGLRPEIVCDMNPVLSWLWPDQLSNDLEEDLDILASKVNHFIKAVRYVGCEPVFFIESAIGCDQTDFHLLLPSLREEYLKSLTVQSHCTRLTYLLKPLLFIQAEMTLIDLNVKVIRCHGNTVSEIYAYALQQQVCGVLSTNPDFFLLTDCCFIDLAEFDLKKALRHQNAINSQPLDIFYVTTSIDTLLLELNISKEQLIDIAILSGNIYTHHLNILYKLASYLGLKEDSIDELLKYVRKRKSPIFEEDPRLAHLCEVNPDYQRAVTRSYHLYLSPQQLFAPSPINSLSYWVSRRMQDHQISSITYAVVNSNSYWRRIVFESIAVGRQSIHCLLVPFRKVFYKLLGVENVSEYGCTSRKLFTKTDIFVPVEQNDPDVILQQILDIQVLPLGQKLYIAFNLLIHKEIVVQSSLLQTLSLDSITDGTLVKHAILCLSLYIYGQYLAQLPNELNGLLQFIFTHQVGIATSVTRRPCERSLIVSSWFSHLLETIYHVFEVLDLDYYLPQPKEMFLPLTAAKVISCYLSTFEQDLSFTTHLSSTILCLSSVKTFRSSCLPSSLSASGLHPQALLELFHKASIDVETHLSQVARSVEDASINLPDIVPFQETAGTELSIDNHQQENEHSTVSDHYYHSKSDDAVSTPQGDEPNDMSNKSPDGSLSIMQYKDCILKLIECYNVTCIYGEAGCGKSTMVPQFILEGSQKKEKCSIIATQPHRVGVLKLAQQVATQRNECCGFTVGYYIGGQKCVSKTTQITYCTAGYLLQVLTHRPLYIRNYSHIILDEVHERTIDADLIMLLVRKLVSELSPNTKLILMSATMQGSLFVSYFQEVFGPKAVSKPFYVGAKNCHVDEYFIDEISCLLCKPILIWNKGQELAKVRLSPISLQRISENFEDYHSHASVTMFAKEICTELIVYCSQLGESILVFLPGISEILDYYDILQNELELRKLLDYFEIFILHSQIPVEEQHDLLEPPLKNKIHIIISTNIGESSLTIPMLRMVINFGICRIPKFDHRRKMTCLVQTWCSKAACAQRAGRVGRVFDGIAVHLFPKLFYRKCLSDYDQSEMHSSSLGKLLLRARQLGEELGIGKPSELLKLAIEPPSLLQMDNALQELVNIGAIVRDITSAVPENSDVTLLGKFSLCLPLELDLCRLIFFGLCFGCPIEGIVIAASLSLQQDFFTMPSRFIIKDQKQYLNCLDRNIRSRFFFDGDMYSDSIMVCRVFKKWLAFNDACQLNFTKTMAKFCHEHSIKVERFHLFLTSVKSLANQILQFLPQGSNMFEQISYLSRGVNSFKLCENDNILRVLIMASFVQNALVGKTKLKSDFKQERKLAHVAHNLMLSKQFDPKLTLSLPITAKITKDILKELTSTIVPKCQDNVELCHGVALIGLNKETSNDDCQIDLAVLWQFGERRSKWQVEGVDAIFSTPFSPYEMIWQRFYAPHERVHVLSWRNKCAFYRDHSVNGAPPISVVASIQGGESLLFVRGKALTLLPSIAASKLPILLLLAFQSFQSSIQLRVYEKFITALKINGFELDFQQWQQLTAADIWFVNNLRHELSRVITCTDQNSMLFMQQVLCIQKMISKLANVDSCKLIPEPYRKKQFHYEPGKIEFYPLLRCSLLQEAPEQPLSVTYTTVDLPTQCYPVTTSTISVPVTSSTASLSTSDSSQLNPSAISRSVITPLIQNETPQVIPVKPVDIAIPTQIPPLSIESAPHLPVACRPHLPRAFQPHVFRPDVQPLISPPPGFPSRPLLCNPPQIPQKLFPPPQLLHILTSNMGNVIKIEQLKWDLMLSNVRFDPLDRTIVNVLLKNGGKMLLSHLKKDDVITSASFACGISLIPEYFCIRPHLYSIIPAVRLQDFVITLAICVFE